MLTVSTRHTVAKKQMGRPKTGADNVAVKIDAQLIRDAKMIASHDGKPVSEFLNAVLKPIIDRELTRVVKTLSERKHRED